MNDARRRAIDQVIADLRRVLDQCDRLRLDGAAIQVDHAIHLVGANAEARLSMPLEGEQRGGTCG